MQKLNYSLGLDIGISSVGWGILELDENKNPIKIVDAGVRIFSPGENVKTGESKAEARRIKRGVRRIIRRRNYRLDCVKNLLYQYGYLKSDLDENSNVSDKEEQLKNEFNNMVAKYYENNPTNPYKLKVDALNRKLTNEELSIILVHYAKHRGYSSNREEETSKDSENGKVKNSIKINEQEIKDKNYQTVSEMITKSSRFDEKIRNTTGDYKMIVTREMYRDEIEKVLDSQIKFGLINEEFKNEYIKTWGNQRHYSKGPGYAKIIKDEQGKIIRVDSPYGGNQIEKMTGICKFTKEPRAPKYAPTSEVFVALGKLVNLRYKTSDDKNYKKLSQEQINEILELAQSQDKVTYKNLIKILNDQTIIIKDLDLNNEQYKKFISEFKTKVLKLDIKERVELQKLTNEEKEKYAEMYKEKVFSKTLIELTGYTKIRKEIIKNFGKEVWEQEKNNYDMLDEIVRILTNCKLNEDIVKEVQESNKIDNKYIETITNLPNFKDHLMISTTLIKQLIPLMKEGKRYDEAMKELNYDHANPNENLSKSDLLIPVNQEKDITNQRVIRSLTQSRKVLNAIIKKYGMPKIINIETARELAKTMQERKIIEKEQQNNYEENKKIKEELVETFPSVFSSIEKVKSTDLLRYKLWKEQQEFCPYSLEKIKITDLFDKNTTQIDHILPYSRTFNDNYQNKTLVFTKCNQEKGNLTPYEWLSKQNEYDRFQTFINNLPISERKKQNYLLKNLTPEIENEMRNQNLNDTKYISKKLVSLIKANLNVEEVGAYSGSITGKLRAKWGLNGLTHSLESKDYYIKKNTYEEIKKNRENHLHHAMDALVIASINKKLETRMMKYDKYKRYINRKTKNQIESYMYHNDVEKVDNEYFDLETGEIKTIDMQKYIMELQQANEIIETKKGYNLLFPEPFKNFGEEVKLFVYERDNTKQKKLLEETRKYTKEELEKITPIIPSFAKNKEYGQLHAETYKGLKTINDTTYVTTRVAVNSKSFKYKNLESIIEKDAGSKIIYETLKEWFENNSANPEKTNGEELFKKIGYPVNKLNNNPIKKVKLQSEYNGKGHIINNKSIVDKDTIYRVQIYKSKEEQDDKLYFVGLDLIDIDKVKKYKKGKIEDFNLQLWWGQGNNNKMISYEKLLEEYILCQELKKTQLLRITKKDKTSGIGYLVGFSSGMLEIGSTLGDGLDLIGENNLFDTERKQYQITISTVEKIEPLSITILGEINGIQTSCN